MMLTQTEADELRCMPKQLSSSAKKSLHIPALGRQVQFEATSIDGRNSFIFDANRPGVLKLNKITYNERYAVSLILARLDISGPPHTNPAATDIPLDILVDYNGFKFESDEAHCHLYVEGYNDKWAVPANILGFHNTDDLAFTFRQFLQFCGVESIPDIEMMVA